MQVVVTHFYLHDSIEFAFSYSVRTSKFPVCNTLNEDIFEVIVILLSNVGWKKLHYFLVGVTEDAAAK